MPSWSHYETRRRNVSQQSETTTGGIAGKVVGKVKEAAGSLTGDPDLQREGRLPPAPADAEAQARKEAAEAEQAQAQADLVEQKAETEEERARLQVEVEA